MRKDHRRAKLITLFTFTFALLNTCIFILYNLVFIFSSRWKDLPDDLFRGFAVTILAIVALCLCSFRIWNNSEKGKKDSDNTLLLDTWRQKLISTVKYDVCERLDKSLNKQKLLDLEFAHENIDIATVIWHSASQSKGLPEILKQKQKVILLGDPGAGKTTELLRLAKILLTKIEEDNNTINSSDNEPIPVIFELTTWEPSQKFEDWLVERLTLKYNIPENIGKQLLHNGHILLLLDGLNEQDKNLEKCLVSIKAFTQENHYPKQLQGQALLVCCRLQEFEKLDKDKNFDFLKRVRVKELSKEKINKYFVNAKRQDLKKIFENNDLFEKVKLPLHLKVLIETYQNSEVEEYIYNQKSNFHEIVNFLRGGKDIFLKRILTDYINHKLSEIKLSEKESHEKYFPFKKYIKHRIIKAEETNKKRTKKRLAWLAKAIQDHKQKEFIIENIQPTWLEKSHQKWLYRISFGLISGLILGISTAFLSVLIYQLMNHFVTDYITIDLLKKRDSEAIKRISESVINVIIGIHSGLISGLISVVVYGEVNQVLFFEQFQLSWQRIVKFWSNIPSEIIFVIVILMSLPEKISAKIFENINSGNQELISTCEIHQASTHQFHVSVDIFFIVLLITLFLSHLPFSIATNQTKNRTYPNQGIRASMINAGTITLINSLLATFMYIALCHFILNTNSKIGDEIEFIKLADINAIVFGLCSGFLSGFIFGGITVIQHVIIRFILWNSGSIPWNYARFLADAAERGFIIQIGGRYRFQHELLREYFAELD